VPDPFDQPSTRPASDAPDDTEVPGVNVLGSEVDPQAGGDGEVAPDKILVASPGAEDEVVPGEAGEDGESDGKGEEPEPDAKPKRRALRSVLEWAAVIAGAFLVAFVVRTTLAQAFWIPSPSMEPTLHEGDRVLVNKLSYRLHDVNRGDIIVFERPEEAASANPQDDIKDLIKRVVGLPGDTIEARADGVVYINDRRLNEPYLPSGTRTGNLPRQEVPEGHVFVMGDNRNNSSDSREFGAVDEDLIVGRAFMRIYPLGDIGGL
jgi:signal peptidase I